MIKTLVTGGAGFIGSHLVDMLLEKGYEVRILDNLDPQVHGQAQELPAYLNSDAEFIHGDVQNIDTLRKALDGIEVVFHQAAAVGIGQSMYKVAHYAAANTLGVANLLEIIANEKHNVEKVITASSMSLYGEGEYRCPECGTKYPKLRPETQLKARQWEHLCPEHNIPLEPLPTSEEKPLNPTSIYAITKRDHEEMPLTIGRAYRVPTIALRYFNVYGPRQALSNPYTGVCAIFGGRILNNNSPVVYEDGLQTRDFIHVTDIARANIMAMENGGGDYEALNVGTGRNISILDIARILIEKVNPKAGLEPEVTHKFREGDIRHCFGNVTKIKKMLGFKAKVKFEDGISDLTEWMGQQDAEDGFQKAKEELEKRGLTER